MQYTWAALVKFTFFYQLLHIWNALPYKCNVPQST